MTNIFEQLMKSNQEITESSTRQNLVGSTKKIKSSNIKVESRRIFKEAEDDFSELDAEFSVTPDEAEEKEDEVVLVIDPEIDDEEEVPEDAAEQMIGDSVYKCPVCGSNYVCSCDEESSIMLNDDGTPAECPICNDDHDQILVGEIAPAEGAGEEDHSEPVKPEEEEIEDEEEVTETEEVEEGLKESKKFKVKAISSNGKDVVTTKTYKAKSKDEAEEKARKELGDFKFEIIEEGNFLDKDHKAPSKKDQKRIAKDLKKLTKKDDIEESAKTARRHYCKVNEDLDDDGLELDIEDTVCPDCGAVPCECGSDIEEKKEESPAVEIDADVVNLVLDDKRFESLITRMIRENYKGNPAFKITRCALRSNKFIVEYLVREGRKSTKGKLVGEGLNAKARTMKIRFVDKGVFTENFTRRPAIVVECVRLRSVIIPTKISYDYKVKVNEQLYRVKGAISHKK